MYNKKPAKLILENGKVFSGFSLGKIGQSAGEVCFNTGMTGYQEILTDPSYSGQLITMTYPHIGNYGINEEDIESSRIYAKGFIVKEACEIPSNFRSTGNIDQYLRKHHIVGIQGIDTRYLTRIIRNEGAMNAIISTEDTNKQSLLKKVKQAPNMSGLDLAKVKLEDGTVVGPFKQNKLAVVGLPGEEPVADVKETKPTKKVSVAKGLETLSQPQKSLALLGIDKDIDYETVGEILRSRLIEKEYECGCGRTHPANFNSSNVLNPRA